MRIQKNRSKLGQARYRSKPVYFEEPHKATVRLVTIRGETHSIKEWSKLSGVPYMTLAQRIARGVEPEFLLTPVRKRFELPDYSAPSRPMAYLIENIWRSLSEALIDCIEWPFGRTRGGYGRVKYGDNVHYTHRLAYQLAGNEIPAGMLIRHKCDNPPCFNVRHLEPGTNFDNVRDSFERGKRGLIKLVNDLAF